MSEIDGTCRQAMAAQTPWKSWGIVTVDVVNPKLQISYDIVIYSESLCSAKPSDEKKKGDKKRQVYLHKCTTYWHTKQTDGTTRTSQCSCAYWLTIQIQRSTLNRGKLICNSQDTLAWTTNRTGLKVMSNVLTRRQNSLSECWQCWPLVD